MDALLIFIDLVSENIDNQKLVKLTLSKPKSKGDVLNNVYIRQIDIKGQRMLSFTYHYQTKDTVKNYDSVMGSNEVKKLLEATFKNANLLTTEKNHALQTSKKGKITISQSKASHFKESSVQHDRVKVKKVKPASPFLKYLGVSDEQGLIIPKMADKYRQINKFLEIMEGLMASLKSWDDTIKVVDMGSGKGYLTFALFDYLVNEKKLNAQVTGIELRKELVDHCNDIAAKCEFDGLSFESQTIEEFDDHNVDILIALHACDTATDDAIAKGVVSKAKLIVCAPCCHKQVRQQLKGKEQQNPILKYGIFKERQYEMVTDTIRALIMEREGYESKVFEFVSNEHTRKNVMLVGINNHNPKPDISKKIDSIKEDFGIEYQYLEKLLEI